MKIAVVYWSGTGNTKTMAKAVAEGAKNAGADVDLLTSDNVSNVDNYDNIAFGCAATGNEELEETSFEPMFSSVEKNLKNKKVALFGSYGWGGGEWMNNWKERINGKCASIVGTVICNDSPDENTIKELKELGEKIAS